MFTGIITHTGTLVAREPLEDGLRLQVCVPDFPTPTLGASICNSGVCLTVTAVDGDVLSFDVMKQTLDLTTLGQRAVGDTLNIEGSLRVGDELGGHFVYGHVDGIATVTHVEDAPDARRVTITLPEALKELAVPQGSITLDGVSLTVAQLTAADLTVSLVPHTLACTTLSQLTPGSQVNVEVDMMMKYVQQLLVNRSSHGSSNTC